MRRPNLTRRLALGGATVLAAAAGVGGYLAIAGGSTSVRLTAAPAVPAPALQAPSVENGATTPDTDNVQQGDQSGPQGASGVDSAAHTGNEAAASEAPSNQADGANGNSDTPGSPDQQGDFNN